MKFLVILVIIGVVVCPPTKEELIKRATDLEARLQADIDKVRTAHPIEARILEVEERELKVLVGELRTAHLPAVVVLLEIRLSAVERRVEETLRRIDGRTGTPPTARPTTGAPSSPRPTGAPSSPRPTGAPSSPRPTGAPSSPRPTGAPSSPRPTGAPSSPRPTGAPSSPRPTGAPSSPRPTGAPSSPRPTTGAPTTARATSVA